MRAAFRRGVATATMALFLIASPIGAQGPAKGPQNAFSSKAPMAETASGGTRSKLPVTVTLPMLRHKEENAPVTIEVKINGKKVKAALTMSQTFVSANKGKFKELSTSAEMAPGTSFTIVSIGAWAVLRPLRETTMELPKGVDCTIGMGVLSSIHSVRIDYMDSTVTFSNWEGPVFDTDSVLGKTQMTFDEEFPAVPGALTVVARDPHHASRTNYYLRPAKDTTTRQGLLLLADYSLQFIANQRIVEPLIPSFLKNDFGQGYHSYMLFRWLDRELTIHCQAGNYRFEVQEYLPCDCPNAVIVSHDELDEFASSNPKPTILGILNLTHFELERLALGFKFSAETVAFGTTDPLGFGTNADTLYILKPLPKK